MVAVPHAGPSGGMWGRLAARAVVAAGKVAGRVLRVAPTVPGLAGAALVSACGGEVTGHVFGHGLAPWVAGLAGGMFLLLLDRRIP